MRPRVSPLFVLIVAAVGCLASGLDAPAAFPAAGREGDSTNGLPGAAGLLEGGVPDSVASVYGPEAPGGPAMDRLGVSPANQAAPPEQQYFYRVQLRDALGQAIAGFPAQRIWLDFSGCPPAYGRPADGRVHPDADADAQGILEWRQSLAFGGADAASVPLLVQDGAGTEPRCLHVVSGGVRSPDQDGDGFIDPIDVDAWVAARAAAGPPWRGDLGPSSAFDDGIAPADSTVLASHRGQLLYYEAVADSAGSHRLIVQGIVDLIAERIRGAIKTESGRADTTVNLTPGGEGESAGGFVLTCAGSAGEDVRFESQYHVHSGPDTLFEEHEDSVSAYLREPLPGGPGVMGDPLDSSGVHFQTSTKLTPSEARVKSSVEYRPPLPDFKSMLSFKYVDVRHFRLSGAPVLESMLNVACVGESYKLHYDWKRTEIGTSSSSEANLSVDFARDSVRIRLEADRLKRQQEEAIFQARLRAEWLLKKGSKVTLLHDQGPQSSRTALTCETDVVDWAPELSFGPEYDWVNRKWGGMIHLDFAKLLCRLFGTQTAETAVCLAAQQSLRSCCDGVCEDSPVLADTTELADLCEKVAIRSVVASSPCAPVESLTVVALPCRQVDVPARLPGAARELRLGPIGPNPVLAGTTLAFDLPRPGAMDLSVFDVHGRRVVTLLAGAHPAGRFSLSWDGRGRSGARLPAGVYLVRLALDDEARSAKVVLAP